MSLGPIPIALLSNHGHIVGGGEISLLDLAATLDRSRWSPIVVTPAEGEVAARCRAVGLDTSIVPLPTVRRPTWQAWRSVAALRRLCRETGARLLHANGSRAMIFAALAGVLRDCPVIWHVRVADPEPFLDRLLARRAAVIVVNSEAVRQRLAWVKHPKVRVVYNGVDLSRYTPREPSGEARAAWGVPAAAPLIMSVGRFVAYKRYDVLIDAAALMHRDVPDAHWVLVGDGELRSALTAQAAERGLEKHVHVIGWRDDVPELLSHGDLFVLPSHGEHFGRVLIEAMAMAKPVVATASGGVPEIVQDGETGMLVPAADPAALSRAMTSLIRDRATAQRMGRSGRRRVEERFSLERHVREIERIYAECIGAQIERL